MPAAKQMVGHEAEAGDNHEGVANPDGVGQAPKPLPDHLWVARNPDNPRLPQMHLIGVVSGDNKGPWYPRSFR